MTWFFVKTDMVVKGISQDDISKNWVGRWANIIFRMRTMIVSESSPTNSIRRVVPIFTDTLVVYFQEQQDLF